MNYYLRAFNKYADFKGRDNRPQYWYFFLFNFLVSLILSLIAEELVSIYFLAIFVPSLAISIRRLHDIGKSGWWILISLIPIIGTIWLIILLATKGQSKDNEYGAAV
jgi:uncharacterized membrane protein YhaH (DUF805 family)